MNELVRHKNLTFVNSTRFVGIRVCVMWRKKKMVKYFSFSRFGNKTQGMALKCREEFERILEKPRTERRISSRIYHQGITEGWKKTGGKKGQQTRCYFITACPNKGKLWRTSVSIAKHGEKALEMAREIRKISLENYFQ